MGQGGNVKPAGECHCLLIKYFSKVNLSGFKKVKPLNIIVGQKILQFLFLSYVVNLS